MMGAVALTLVTIAPKVPSDSAGGADARGEHGGRREDYGGGATPLFARWVSLDTVTLSDAHDEAGALTTAYPARAVSLMLASPDSTDDTVGDT